MKNLPEILGCIIIIAFVWFGIWYTTEVWGECRETNSFIYCMRLISR